MDKYVMRSYKSTIGGALSVLGKTLMGAGVLPVLAGGTPSKLLAYIALTGFVIDALGSFFGHLFAADREEVQRVINATTSDAETKFITKEEVADKLDTKPK